MDFAFQRTTVAGIASADADALLVVLAGAKRPDDLPRALGQALDAAVKQGDLALDAGRDFHRHRKAKVGILLRAGTCRHREQPRIRRVAKAHRTHRQ